MAFYRHLIKICKVAFGGQNVPHSKALKLKSTKKYQTIVGQIMALFRHIVNIWKIALVRQNEAHSKALELKNTKKISKFFDQKITVFIF